MILPLLFLLQDVSPPPAQDGEDIVVMGKRLDTWRGQYRVRGGQVICRTTKSTRDAEIDAIGCAALVTCLTPIATEFEAIAKGPRGGRDRRLDTLLKTRYPCLTETRKVGIERLVAQRRGE